MLTLTIPASEFYDEKHEVFVKLKELSINVEHSLISISKWESKYHKPFLDKKEWTEEETLDYIRCMTMNHSVPDYAYYLITPEQAEEIRRYIENPMSASIVPDMKQGRVGREIVTSELIYYWMVSLQIPLECEKWHLNRLLMLVKVCNYKNAPPKKRSKNDVLKQQRNINEARKAAANSSG